MKKVQMCSWSGEGDLSAHAIAGFKQRPVKRFAIECNQHPALGEPLRQRKQQRALLAVVAHEELFDFESATLPPCEADQKRVGAAPARQSRGFRVEKYPLLGIRNLLGCVRHEQLQGPDIRRKSRRFAEPAMQGEMFAILVCFGRGTENLREPVWLIWECERRLR